MKPSRSASIVITASTAPAAPNVCPVQPFRRADGDARAEHRGDGGVLCGIVGACRCAVHVDIVDALRRHAGHGQRGSHRLHRAESLGMRCREMVGVGRFPVAEQPQRPRPRRRTLEERERSALAQGNAVALRVAWPAWPRRQQRKCSEAVKRRQAQRLHAADERYVANSCRDGTHAGREGLRAGRTRRGYDEGGAFEPEALTHVARRREQVHRLPVALRKCERTARHGTRYIGVLDFEDAGAARTRGTHRCGVPRLVTSQRAPLQKSRPAGGPVPRSDCCGSRTARAPRVASRRRRRRRAPSTCRATCRGTRVGATPRAPRGVPRWLHRPRDRSP